MAPHVMTFRQGVAVPAWMGRVTYERGYDLDPEPNSDTEATSDPEPSTQTTLRTIHARAATSAATLDTSPSSSPFSPWDSSVTSTSAATATAPGANATATATAPASTAAAAATAAARGALDSVETAAARFGERIAALKGAATRPRWRRKKRRRRKCSAVAATASRGMTHESWAVLRNGEGQVRNMGILLRLVQVGGVEHDLRPQVWPLLLGCISADDDLATQNSKWRSAEVEFARLCALARDAGAARQHFRNRGAVEDWDSTQRRILADAVRTTRDGPLFQGADRDRSVRRMERLLMAYALVDPTTGYCQGMADLAAPFVHLYSTDHEAYFLFKAMMRSIRANFQEGMTAISAQLAELRELLSAVDPPLLRALERLGADDCSVAFQMVLLSFRRELPWESTFLFWEALWASETLARGPLRTYAAAALFATHRRSLLKMQAHDEVVSFVNNLPAPIDPLELAADALQLWEFLHVERAGVGGCGCASLLSCAQPE